MLINTNIAVDNTLNKLRNGKIEQIYLNSV